MMRRLQAKTKVLTDTINDFLFGGGCAFNAASEADMLHSVHKFCDACNNFGLIISTKKTEVIYQPAPGKPYTDTNPNISEGPTSLSTDKGSVQWASLHILAIHSRPHSNH